MKKVFTLLCALMGMSSLTNAASIEDLKLCKHSYVLVCDEVTNDGTVKAEKNTLYGDGFFFTPTGQDKSTSKGKSNPAEMTAAVTDPETGDVITPAEYRYGEEFAKKYGEYGTHYNSLRLKNAQDIMVMHLTAGSKVIFLLQGNNKSGKDARWPKIAKDAALTQALNDAPTADFTGTTDAGFKYEWTAEETAVYYIGSYNGDMFLGYVIVEANEAPGTPSVKVGPQTYENGLYFREVTCKPMDAEIMGRKLPTLCTYTLDGSDPDKESTIYTEPIKCYKNQVVRFQAFIANNGQLGNICTNADNEGIVSFSFDAPTIVAEGANVTVTSPYEGAKNFLSYGEVQDQEANTATLTESATVTAYSKIINGEYEVFTTKSVFKDVYVLNPLKEEKTITVSGVAKDSLDSAGNAVYYVENGAITTNKMDFFVKNLEFGVVTSKVDSIKKYQVNDQEVYIKMNNTNISFLVDETDSVDIVVTCSKNACKNVYVADSTQWQCFVNVDGNNYGGFLFDKDNQANLDAYKNVISFSVGAGVHTFQKYSGTGNILISSIKFTPRVDCVAGIKEVVSEKKFDAKKSMVNGRLVIQTSNGTFNAAGVRVE